MRLHSLVRVSSLASVAPFARTMMGQSPPRYLCRAYGKDAPKKLKRSRLSFERMLECLSNKLPIYYSYILVDYCIVKVKDRSTKVINILISNGAEKGGERKEKLTASCRKDA